MGLLSFLTFKPKVKVNLPQPCDFVIDYREVKWILPHLIKVPDYKQDYKKFTHLIIHDERHYWAGSKHYVIVDVIEDNLCYYLQIKNKEMP